MSVNSTFNYGMQVQANFWGTVCSLPDFSDIFDVNPPSPNILTRIHLCLVLIISTPDSENVRSPGVWRASKNKYNRKKCYIFTNNICLHFEWYILCDCKRRVHLWWRGCSTFCLGWRNWGKGGNKKAEVSHESKVEKTITMEVENTENIPKYINIPTASKMLFEDEQSSCAILNRQKMEGKTRTVFETWRWQSWTQSSFFFLPKSFITSGISTFYGIFWL